MKTLLIFLLSSCSLFAQLNISNPFYVAPVLKSSAGGGGAAFSDTFTGDNQSLSANWTLINGMVTNLSNVANAPSTADFTERAAIYTAGACASADQYVKVTIDGAINGNGGGVILRHTLSGSLYQIQFDEDDEMIRWKYFPTAGGTAVDVQILIVTAFTYPITAGVVVTGTGNSTEVRVWLNPTANAPTSISSWDGGAATYTLTDDPATAADSGTYLGIGVNNSSGAATTWDNWFGGEVP